MELNELKTIWQSYDAKLEKTLALNMRLVELIQSQKVKSKLTPVFWQRITELAFHLIAVVLLSAFLYANITLFPYAASAVLLIAFYVVAIVSCLKQVMIIKRMDYSNDIITIQSSLVILQTNVVNHARLAVLCIPTFLAYPVVVSKAIADLGLNHLINFDIIAQSNGNWWTAQLYSTLFLIPLCIWFYSHVNYKNIHEEWVKKFIEKTIGKRMRKAMEFANELNTLK